MTKSRTSYPGSASSSKLGIGTSSNLIAKLKPKIRIIHVYAPEIIKTDAANFRELVQRLTGKPEDDEEEKGRKRKTTKTPPKRSLDPVIGFQTKQGMMVVEDQQEQDFTALQNGLRIKKEGENDNDNGGGDQMLWGKSSRSNGKFSGGFLEGFSEFDCFMEEFGAMPVV
ncbi:VQ motif-containing protein 25-like [Neltuma alba]|uniref:VQ motif-containing protein 25-like n=1 Tax=Neltuma alba TaxID=207710 RepID=UPI0010A2B60C|nr:VQ motif-containing protein 25-like [Prosopis alba]